VQSFAAATGKVLIEGPAGDLEVAVSAPDSARRGIALVAHPHPQQGGTLDNKVAQTLAKTFHGLDYVAVRFNFRGVGGSQGVFDQGEGETEDGLAALAYARSTYGGQLPVALAGFSFGAYVQTRIARRVDAERLVLVGPAVMRFPIEHVPADTIVIHGEQDEIVPLADVLEWARPQSLPIVVFPGCTHFFHGRLPQLRDTIAGMWHRGSAPGH
jgi:alpha/beta superfamily hydrolase